MHSTRSASDTVYQLLAHGLWFSPGTPASSTTKTGRHDIADILLNVALNTIKSNQKYFVLYLFNTLASSTDSGNDVLTVSGNVKARMPASIPTAPNIINGNAFPSLVGTTEPLKTINVIECKMKIIYHTFRNVQKYNNIYCFKIPNRYIIS